MTNKERRMIRSKLTAYMGGNFEKGLGNIFDRFTITKNRNPKYALHQEADLLRKTIYPVEILRSNDPDWDGPDDSPTIRNGYVNTNILADSILSS